MDGAYVAAGVGAGVGAANAACAAERTRKAAAAAAKRGVIGSPCDERGDLAATGSIGRHNLDGRSVGERVRPLRDHERAGRNPGTADLS